MNPKVTVLKEERETLLVDRRSFGERKRLESLKDRKKTKQGVCVENEV